MPIFNRETLHKILKEIIGNDNVYFQPPESAKLKYPCIIYSRDDILNEYGNNTVYNQYCAFLITVIDYDPDSEIVRKISQLPMCNFDRHFTSDGLNHDTFILYI